MNPIVYSYNAEIHTYATRAKGVSVYWGGVELQAIVNRYINPIGIANLGYKRVYSWSTPGETNAAGSTSFIWHSTSLN